MYHPGKVLKIFSAKSGEVESANEEVQAMVHMWDDNLLTLLVDPKLEEKIRGEDVVLVDYRPLFDRGPPTPKMIVTKIIRGESAIRTWDKYREYFRKKKKEAGPGAIVPPPQSYIG